jgi:hypothetical protein
VIHSASEFSLPENVQPAFHYSHAGLDMLAGFKNNSVELPRDSGQAFDPRGNLPPPIDLTIVHLHLIL